MGITLNWQELVAILTVVCVLLTGYNSVTIEPLKQVISEQKAEIQALKARDNEFEDETHRLDIARAQLFLQLDNQSKALARLASALEKLADGLKQDS